MMIAEADPETVHGNVERATNINEEGIIGVLLYSVYSDYLPEETRGLKGAGVI